MTLKWSVIEAWLKQEPIRWLILCVFAAGIGYGIGTIHEFGGSMSKAAYDCRNFGLFDYKDRTYRCLVLSKHK